MGLKLSTVFQTELRLRGFQFTQGQVIEILRALADTFADFMRAGEKLHLHGIGTFYTTHRKASEFHCGLVDREVSVGARNVVKFTPSTVLKNAANDKDE